MKPGRKPIFQDRIPTLVNIEREDLEDIRARGLNLPEIVRNAITEALNNSLTPREQLKLDLENIEIDFINTLGWISSKHREVRELYHSGQATRHDLEFISEELECQFIKVVSGIDDIHKDLNSEIFKKASIPRRLDSKKSYHEGRSKIKPINQFRKDCVFHHFHFEINGVIDRNIGIYIPLPLHRSIKHSSMSGKGLREMNNAALLWLCEQAEI